MHMRIYSNITFPVVLNACSVFYIVKNLQILREAYIAWSADQNY